MNCKLSKESIIELQLIPPALDRSEANCPSCHQPFVDHRNGNSEIMYLERLDQFNFNALCFFLKE